MRKILVAIQAACALTLVCGGIELVQSFRNLMHVNPGLDVSHLLTMHVWLPESEYKAGARCTRFVTTLTDRLNHIPGVQSAASINMLPMQKSGTNGDVYVPGLPPHSTSFFAEYRWITGDYLRTMGIALLRGRNFLPEELAGQRPAVIINQTMAVEQENTAPEACLHRRSSEHRGSLVFGLKRICIFSSRQAEDDD